MGICTNYEKQTEIQKNYDKVFTRRFLGQNAPLCSMAYLAKHAHLSVKLYASFILTIMEQETDYKDLLGVI